MWYRFVQFVFNIIFKILFRFEVIGRENIPAQGPVLIASNHVSLLDPPLVGTASSRPVNFMAKEELFTFPLGPIYKSLGAFPVKRGASDRQAIKTALGLLKNKQVLGIFPEGTRSRNGKLGPAEPGALTFAYKTGAAVVPTAVIGSNLAMRKTTWPKIKVIFGQPIYFTEQHMSKEEIEEKSKELMKNIGNMLEKYKI
jgi:1-acyl-sn-glycerol-3-phosphate acyltransferase